MTMLRSLVTLLLLPSIVAQEKDCTLDCQQNAPCAFGEADFSNHTLPSYGYDSDIPLVDTSIDGMYCACPHEWTGVQCEIEYDGCDGKHQCYHGGQCIPGLIDSFGNEQLFCDCEDAIDADGNQYVGKFCEHQAKTFCDDEERIFCVNNAECNDEYPQFGTPCLCELGYEGEHCEYQTISVPECDLECENGGYCVLGSPSEEEQKEEYQYWGKAHDHMYCQCPSAFDGPFCEIAKVECGDNHCFNGGSCIERVIDGKTLYNCDCTTTYTDDTSYAGRFCQFEATSFCKKNSGHLFCVNDGDCKADPYEGCDCKKGFTGFSCEFVVSLEGEDTDGDGEPESPFPDSGGVGRPLIDPNITACSLECENGGTCRHGTKEDGILNLDDMDLNAPYLEGTYTKDTFEHCVCSEGFVGLFCEHRVEICGENEHICLHGGKCVSDGDSYSCECSDTDSDLASAFAGVSCQHPANDICTIGDPEPGQAVSFCVNQGTCKDKVRPGAPAPGCTCEDGWVGPHCELRVGEEVPLPRSGSETPSVDPDSSSKGKGAVAVVLVISLLAMAIVSVFSVSLYRRRRSKERDESLTKMLFGSSNYRDRPEEEINIAPRRSSTYDDVYIASVAPSSTDPMATFLAPNKPEILDEEEDDQPQVYIGPPRDEDGHELHQVDLV